MKKIFALGLIVFLAVGVASGSITLKVASFSPTGTDFKNIYGGGITYGVDLSFTFAKDLEFWVGASTFSKRGKTSYTQEETSLSLIPISGGVKWQIITGKRVSPYIAVGVEYVLYKESNIIGDINTGGVGFLGKGGALFHISKSFGIDAYIVYSSCSMHPADFAFNIGGLEFGAGIVYIF